MSKPPYRFDILPLGTGQIGIGPLPGCDADLAGDLVQIMNFTPSLVISMTSTEEMTTVGAQGLPDHLARAGIAWVHFPVTDFGLPDNATNAGWQALSEQAHTVLAAGGKIFVHCRAGLGRSGMVTLRLMVEAGEAPDAALARLRAVRPGAVETGAQLDWASLAGHEGSDK